MRIPGEWRSKSRLRGNALYGDAADLACPELIQDQRGGAIGVVAAAGQQPAAAPAGGLQQLVGRRAAILRQLISRGEGQTALRFNSNGGRVKDILGHIEAASQPALKRYAARGVRKTVRFMVIGIPNVGKSTFINRLHGSAIAKAGDRPGVTRANQWVRIGPFLEVLDTPGMLPPRLDDQESARLLAYLGSIRDEIMDTEDLAGGLMALLNAISPAALGARYRLPESCGSEPHELLEAACRGRGWLLSGGRLDTDRAAALVLDEFRAGKIGRITIERA